MWELQPQCIFGSTWSSEHMEPAEPEWVSSGGAPEVGQRRILSVFHLHHYCGQPLYIWQRFVSTVFSLPVSEATKQFLMCNLFCSFIWLNGLKVGWLKIGLLKLIRVKYAILLFHLGTPSSVRRVGSPLSRSNSPNSSPKSTGRRQGRLRLPQLGSRHRLSNSKDSLDSSSNSGCKESGPEPESSMVTEAAPQVTGATPEPNMQDSPWTLVSSSTDCDVIMMNGLSQDNSQINGHSDASTELDSTAHQRDEVCLEPIYNLYAISVGLPCLFKPFKTHFGGGFFTCLKKGRLMFIVK